jgi:phosphoribosyl 1,2-cyclic phosphodiesterase
MWIRFWGTRGSLPKPGQSTLRYGGNTSCVEIRTDDGTLIVLDSGTGARDLGLALTSHEPQPLRGHLLFSHTHWDHIQGFPFFTPVFQEGNSFDIYAPHGIIQSLADTLRGQMQRPYFPITVDDLAAEIRCHDLTEDTFHVGPAHVRTRFLNHPALTLGYRIEVDGAVLVYATDHEPHGRDRAVPESSVWRPTHLEDQRHADLLEGADLVIHDAQYTAHEYANKASWGHSTVEYVVDMAMQARVKRLALYHHDPERDDAELDGVVAACRTRIRAADSSLEVFAAAEGDGFALGASAPASSAPLGNHAPPVAAIDPRQHSILVIADDRRQVEFLAGALAPEGYRLVARGQADALTAAHDDRPSLIVLDAGSRPGAALDLCRRLREHSDQQICAIPIVLTSQITNPDLVAAAFAAGANDYLARPLTSAYVRTRARTWLLRSNPTPAAVS